MSVITRRRQEVGVTNVSAVGSGGTDCGLAGLGMDSGCSAGRRSQRLAIHFATALRRWCSQVGLSDSSSPE